MTMAVLETRTGKKITNQDDDTPNSRSRTGHTLTAEWSETFHNMTLPIKHHSIPVRHHSMPERPTLPPAGIDPADWELLVFARPNVLLFGPSSALDAVLSALRPHLRCPIHRWSANSGCPLPQHSAETLLLEGVEGCPISEQQALLTWLAEADRRPQVISTTSQPLFEHVQRGNFRIDLYYRLNWVYLDLSRS
jgi:hypothetical protein